MISNTSVEPRFVASALLKFLEVLDGFYAFSSSKFSGSIIISEFLERITQSTNFMSRFKRQKFLIYAFYSRHVSTTYC